MLQDSLRNSVHVWHTLMETAKATFFFFWLCDVLLVKQSCLILEQKSSHVFHLRVIRGRLDYSSHKPDVQSHRQKLGCVTVLYAHR